MRLKLEFNDKGQESGLISNGIDFIGYIVRPEYLLVRRRVVNRLKARLMQYEKLLNRQKNDNSSVSPFEKGGDELITKKDYRVLIYDTRVLGKCDEHMVFVHGSFENGQYVSAKGKAFKAFCMVMPFLLDEWCETQKNVRYAGNTSYSKRAIPVLFGEVS